MDAARGVAIAMMVVYHLTYDLDYFGGYPIESTSGFWARFADATAGAFLFLVGVSLAISYSRASAGRPGRSLFGKYLLRGLRILAYGMALTVVFFLLGMGVVAFGILHLIGVSIILAYPLLKYRFANLLLGLSLIAVGVYMRIEGLSSESPWLLPFGVVPENLVMPDYRPLLPWFGVVLLGVFAGNVFYGGGWRPALFAGKSPAAARPLLPLGRNSLFIYLVHQPILIALLAALGVVEIGIL
ncbi:MAG TPA: heparan-alpha-glucosaminide N-acetyltransferase [Rubrobacteraceae bacterium]|nr:heparan-alpha-glucosaminide N-acetyltransferase [Rubrobacteraceae bacterium]